MPHSPLISVTSVFSLSKLSDIIAQGLKLFRYVFNDFVMLSLYSNLSILLDDLCGTCKRIYQTRRTTFVISLITTDFEVILPLDAFAHVISHKIVVQSLGVAPKHIPLVHLVQLLLDDGLS